MESIAKIHLSAEEVQLIGNTEWILTKHIIIKKVYHLFGHINEEMRRELTGFDNLPEAIQHQGGKISRGENYRLLPYIILDYPAHFSRNDIIAIRTMFWWGNFFSITLHLSGHHKTRLINNDTLMVFLFLQKKDFFICVNKDEWQHHFEEDNYLQATKISMEVFKEIVDKPFLKVAKKLPLNEWQNAPYFILNTFKELLEFLHTNFQDDKKDLSPVFPITGSGL